MSKELISIIVPCYNEAETLINGLEPVQGPYYRWSDLKAHLERRIAQFTF